MKEYKKTTLTQWKKIFNIGADLLAVQAAA
jgi:hypothetical protein